MKPAQRLLSLLLIVISAYSFHVESYFPALKSTTNPLGISLSRFESQSSCNKITALQSNPGGNEMEPEITRRCAMWRTSSLISSLLMQPTVTHAGSLLEDFGTDLKNIDTASGTNSKSTIGAVTPTKKDESDIEPNLRSNYYYPTNKKRYLPRIKRCSDEIPQVAASIGQEDWDTVNGFATKVADDAILPLKLYTSSLTGGGTNVKVSFVKEMKSSTEAFELSQKSLVKAVSMKNREAATNALQDMSTALLRYRTAGKLLGHDGGGDIPSVDDIRRSASRTQKLMFEKAIQTRDERVAKEFDR